MAGLSSARSQSSSETKDQKYARITPLSPRTIPAENGVCYLQILLAAQPRGYSLARMLTDMDTWGYSFRLGSAQAWFEQDAEDALAWLIQHGVLDSQHEITWRRVQ